MSGTAHNQVQPARRDPQNQPICTQPFLQSARVQTTPIRQRECGPAHGSHLLTASVCGGAASSHSGVSARSSRTSADAGAPTILLGQAPSDRRRQRPPRPGCLIPFHPVSSVALPGRAEACCCYAFCYSSRDAKALSPLGKCPGLRKLVAGAGFEPRDLWVMSQTTHVSHVSGVPARLAEQGKGGHDGRLRPRPSPPSRSVSLANPSADRCRNPRVPPFHARGRPPCWSSSRAGSAGG